MANLAINTVKTRKMKLPTHYFSTKNPQLNKKIKKV